MELKQGIINVQIEGAKYKDFGSQLLSLKVESEIGKIPYAEASLVEGSFAEGNYPILKEKIFEIGKEYTIKVQRSEKEYEKIFSGILVSISLTNTEGHPGYHLIFRHPAFRMLSSVQTRSVSDATETDLIKKILDPYGLSLKEFPQDLSGGKQEQFVQYQLSDWHFLQNRATASGTWTNFLDKQLQLWDPEKMKGKPFNYTLDNLLDFQLGENNQFQNDSLDISWWNQKKNSLETLKEKNSHGKAIKGGAFSYTGFQFSSKNEARGKLREEINRQYLGRRTGYAKMVGNSNPQPGQSLKLNKSPVPFDQPWPIIRVTHLIRSGTWVTELGLGLETGPLARSLTENPPPQVIAEALKWEKDPKGLGRIPVEIPALKLKKYWAYLGQIRAGKKNQAFFLPEKGEHLFLEFLYNSWSHGVILQGLHLEASNLKEPFKHAEDSPFGFHFDPKALWIIDGKNKEIKLETGEGKITINEKGGIQAESKKKIHLESKSNFEIKSSAKVNVKGQTINLN